jgi:diacylglycerol kinase (ATP)
MTVGTGQKPTRFIDAANCAIEGIVQAARSQRHMRFHFAAALAVLFATALLGIPAMEFAVLALAISLVLCAELMNTAIEAVVDLVSPDFHPLARTAKDAAAGAVLVAACGAAVMGYLVLARHIFPLYKEALSMVGTPSEMAALVAILSVVVLVIVIKARIGRGTPLEGGGPSGHAAVAFSVATIVSLETLDPLISLLSLSLAVMVSHSRLLLRIHTLKEVVIGAAAGTGLTLVILAAFKVAA